VNSSEPPSVSQQEERVTEPNIAETPFPLTLENPEWLKEKETQKQKRLINLFK